MLKRVLTGVIAFAIMIPFLIFHDTILLPMGFALCAVLAVYEAFACVGLQKNILLSAPAYMVAGASPILLRVLGWESTIGYVGAVIFGLMLYMFAISVFGSRKIDISAACTALVTCVYSTAGFTAIIFLHDFHEGGEYIYYLIFIGAWITDIFAYFTGFLLGKHKLIPEVSPKKTVEGSIGGVLFCVAAFVGFAYIYNTCLVADGGHSLSYLMMLVVGLITSVIAQIGDLALSVVKRHYGIKDFGKVFPGHGGVLDRFDSIIPVAIILAGVLGFILR